MSYHLRKVSTSHEDKLKNTDQNNLKKEDNKKKNAFKDEDHLKKKDALKN